MQKETRFKNKVLAQLKEIPSLYFVKIQMVATRGIPDILMCYKGHFIAWELKVDGGKPSALQIYNLAKINEAGGIARIVTPETLDKVMEEIKCLDFSTGLKSSLKKAIPLSKPLKCTLRKKSIAKMAGGN